MPKMNQRNYQLLCKVDDNAQINLNDNDGGRTVIPLSVLSDVPESESDKDMLKCDIKVYARNINGLFDNVRDKKSARCWNIKKFISDKVFVLIPYYNKKSDEYYGTDIHMFNSKDFKSLEDNDSFCPVPIFSPEDDNRIDTKKDFERSLIENKVLGKFSNPWPAGGFAPYAVIWKDENGVCVYTDIDQSGNRGSISFSVKTLKSFTKPSDWLDNYFVVDGHVAFINIDSILENNTMNINVNDENKFYGESLNGIDENESTGMNEENANEFGEDETEVKTVNKLSDEIFERFKECVTKKYGLTYDENDLVNFHNSLKTNLLTILAGVSGTGKSKIVTAYADALGIKKDKQFNMVSVRPFWQDDSDLLGFVDTITNTYHPGDSGVVDTLIEAGKDKNNDKMYIIAFDEMNLARVEHYFSQFLSVLEKDPSDRKLQLYNNNLKARLYNSEQYPSELLIPENVRFVGTMNIDETTYQLSDKVLDRANVITLKSEKFSNRISKNDKDESIEFPQISYKQYESSINNEELFDKKQLSFFDELNDCIKNQLPTVGIGWRTLYSIEKFVGTACYFSYDNFSEGNAFDYQVAQRILPKVRGTELMLKTLLNPEDDDSIYKVLENNNNISDFKYTKYLLDKKKREIEVIGFAN